MYIVLSIFLHIASDYFVVNKDFIKDLPEGHMMDRRYAQKPVLNTDFIELFDRSIRQDAMPRRSSMLVYTFPFSITCCSQ